MVGNRNIRFSADFVPSDTDEKKNIAEVRPKKKRNTGGGAGNKTQDT